MSINPLDDVTLPETPIALAHDVRSQVEQFDPDMPEHEAFREVLRRVRAETRAQQARLSPSGWYIKG